MVFINLQIVEPVQKNAAWKSTFLVRTCIRVTPIHYVQSPDNKSATNHTCTDDTNAKSHLRIVCSSWKHGI